MWVIISPIVLWFLKAMLDKPMAVQTGHMNKAIRD
jgi:hypothetical protein